MEVVDGKDLEIDGAARLLDQLGPFDEHRCVAGKNDVVPVMVLVRQRVVEGPIRSARRAYVGATDETGAAREDGDQAENHQDQGDAPV